MQSQPHASAWSCPSTLPLQSPYTSHSTDDYQLYQNACYEQQLYQQHAQQMVEWEQQNMMSQNPYKANEMENDIVLIKVSESRSHIIPKDHCDSELTATITLCKMYLFIA